VEGAYGKPVAVQAPAAIEIASVFRSLVLRNRGASGREWTDIRVILCPPARRAARQSVEDLLRFAIETVCWSGDDTNRIPALARELFGLQPDIILTGGTPATAAVQRETRTIPIVFAAVPEPVAGGIVARLDRPNWNITGTSSFEASMGGKWLELLSEIAPGLKRAAIMFNPDFPTPSASRTSGGLLTSIETAARSLKVEPIITHIHSDVEIETAIMALGREPGGGLVVMPDAFTTVHREKIISAAARNNIPAVYPNSPYATDGGLLSYGFDQVDIFRRAATYVDRILRGEKPGDLPVQFPTKFEMVVNRKTATALGLAIPPSILLRADEVIE
jgi:putative ABC transport system substrate-binding protein